MIRMTFKELYDILDACDYVVAEYQNGHPVGCVKLPMDMLKDAVREKVEFEDFVADFQSNT